jgi:hypothetical protein
MIKITHVWNYNKMNGELDNVGVDDSSGDGD